MIARDGVTINQISPGKIVSEQILANYSVQELDAYSKKDIPLGRLGTSEELGYLAAFFGITSRWIHHRGCDTSGWRHETICLLRTDLVKLL